jgi:hypothetical protein
MRSAGDTIGHAGAALVEEDETGEGRQALLEGTHARDFPAKLDM